MPGDLSKGIVRILDSDGDTAGIGFVITNYSLIATCAHVVEAAVAGPEDGVRVVFHATGEEHEAQVEPDWWRAPDVVPALLEALHDEDAGVRSSAASGLGDAMAQPEVVSALLDAPHEEGAHVRSRAAVALSNATAQPEVLSALLDALHDEAARVGYGAAHALRELARRSSAALLPGMLVGLCDGLKLALWDEIEDPWSRGQDALFEALMAVAPGPQVE